MSSLLWQTSVGSNVVNLIEVNDIPTPNVVVIENTHPRYTVFIAAGVDCEEPITAQTGLAGSTTNANNIALAPGKTTPPITLPSGASLYAISDSYNETYPAGINVYQES